MFTAKPILIYMVVYTMPRTAKLFRNGRSQAVRLPAEFRFEGTEVYVRRDPKTGDVVLSRKPVRRSNAGAGAWGTWI